MTWLFDQAPNVVCITCQSVIAGEPVLVVTHYADDHSWAFMDGQPVTYSEALLVTMANVLERHPDLQEFASLSPGWTATRIGAGLPWSLQEDHDEAEV